MENLKILYKYTTRSRRSNFIRGAESIITNSINNNYTILISVENDFYDPDIYPLPELNCSHIYYINPNAPTTKVDAINRNLNEYNETNNWDILINMSDDMIFIQKGFDDIIRNEFKKENTLDLFLHFPDGNQNTLATMSIIGRTYYERDKYIYHPSYKSLWCDNEAQDESIKRNCYKYVDNIIVNHLHPAYAKSSYDNQYEETESYTIIDRENYINRMENK